ncbi:hypothetical protein [Alkaliflexus imshenetskii]|uniref:hypothetical protein n=1 Tax=Alkaliflexus imshenetskii TaxID=286730 RepID=UPI00047BAAD0|nr:hypothetical protein [Alkaliflexus imshenetskii]
MRRKTIIIIIMSVLALLLILFAAMQFTDEVDWKLWDFVLMGLLLMGTGLLCGFALNRVKSLKYRIVICAVIVIMLILIWAELAVGVFGAPFSGS